VVTSNAPVVVNTRDEQPDGPLARALRAVGLESLPCPTIAIAPPDDAQPLADAIERLTDFDWLTFTSAHAVESMAQHPGWRRAVDSGVLPRVAAVGDATAERLGEENVAVDVVPDGVGGGALADAILRAAGGLHGARVLWPRGNLAIMTFRDMLERAGAVVTAPIAYRTLPAGGASLSDLVAGLAANRFAAIVFCSPSSARNLAGSLGLTTLSALGAQLRVASIGPTTSAALRELGVEVDVEAEKPSMGSLAEAIAARLRVTAGDRT
jgi:uroporphyrinogen III methyltransferase / synthase